MSSSNRPSWLQIIVGLVVTAIAAIQFFLWRRKQKKATELEAELRLLQRYKELLKARVTAEGHEEDLGLLEEKLFDTEIELYEKQEQLDKDLEELQEEKDRIANAKIWEDLFPR